MEQEQARVRAEVRKVTSEIGELTTAVNANHNNIYRTTEKLDAVRTQMQWSQQQLTEWLEKTRAVEEDAQALERYSRADDAKIKELTLQLEKLVTEAGKAKKQLDLEITETHVNHVALEKVPSDIIRCYLYSP